MRALKIVVVLSVLAFSLAAVAQYPNCQICMYGSEDACNDSCDRNYTKYSQDWWDCDACCSNSCGDPPPPHDDNQCDANGCSDPLLIDFGPHGFALTGAAEGVQFDIDGDGDLDAIAWTAGASEDAFLALDRDSNGRIDDAKELFGDATRQARTDAPNGFLALGVFDERRFGGNADGVIGPDDEVWARLLLWVDRSHDGISQADELRSMSESALSGIVLDYRESRRRDKYGNGYRYRSDAIDAGGRKVDVVDVFFAGVP